MQKVKNKIEKLLRLSMSNSPHEAKLAAKKAIELMNKHSLTREDLDKEPIIIKHIEVDYARVPGWYRKLYQNIANINGCYMLWQDGYKKGGKFGKRAKIILVGIESDIINIKYYVDVLQREIQKKAKIFRENVTGEREMVKSYRMGLVRGVYNILYKASQTFNENLKDNAIIPVDTRIKEAKEFYHQKHTVRSVATNFKLNSYYVKGLQDAKNISVSRPVEDNKSNEVQLLK